MSEKLKHYQVVLREKDMDTLKKLTETKETGDALTHAVEFYIQEH